MEVTEAKSHPSVGKNDPPKIKGIPKNLAWSKKKGDDIFIQLLAMEWMIILDDQ